MYVTTLWSFAVRGTAQSALKGNTITFQQDIVKIVGSLLAKPHVLADHLKVVFIGNGTPSREMLTVRREKFYNTLGFLISNHSLYANVTLSTVILPADDVLEEILSTLVLHKDLNDKDGKEHANYTPQTVINSSSTGKEAVVMQSSGVADVDESSVHPNGPVFSVFQFLQGTILILHGPIPINDYNNAALWIGIYPWLFPYGMGGPEMQRK